MRLERVTTTTHPMYSKAMALYATSFPPHEQREMSSQREIMRNADYHFDLIYDEDTFVGVILYWETNVFIYIEHFCILPEMRSQRYGQKVLAAMGDKGKKVILEIDPPIDELANRRKGFYERSGFCENGYKHVHPPYHQEDTGHALVVMSYPEVLPEEVYRVFHTYLVADVMRDVFSK